jgi:hypothetical protein
MLRKGYRGFKQRSGFNVQIQKKYYSEPLHSPVTGRWRGIILVLRHHVFDGKINKLARSPFLPALRTIDIVVLSQYIST